MEGALQFPRDGLNELMRTQKNEPPPCNRSLQLDSVHCIRSARSSCVPWLPVGSGEHPPRRLWRWRLHDHVWGTSIGARSKAAPYGLDLCPADDVAGLLKRAMRTRRYGQNRALGLTAFGSTDVQTSCYGTEPARGSGSRKPRCSAACRPASSRPCAPCRSTASWRPARDLCSHATTCGPSPGRIFCV